MSPTRRRRGALTCISAALVLPGLAGCALTAPDAQRAADAAERFHAAVAESDGEGACALLVPAAVEELEATAGVPCAEAVLAVDLPAASGVVDRHAYGRQAQVALTGDVVFLTVSGDRWLVTGAGCTPRPDRPYDCDVSGG